MEMKFENLLSTKNLLIDITLDALPLKWYTQIKNGLGIH